MGFKQRTDLDSYEEERKKMGLGPNTDLKSYENKRIKAEKSWVLSEVQIWTYKEGRKTDVVWPKYRFEII